MVKCSFVLKMAGKYAVSFDENLNDSFQNCQLDLNIWFWNTDLNQLNPDTLASKFLGHPTTKNLH